MKILRTELPSDVLSKDAVTRAAYSKSLSPLGKSLGNYHYAPPTHIDRIDRSNVLTLKNRYFVGENAVISAAGVDHTQFVELCSKYFNDLPKAKDASVVRRLCVSAADQGGTSAPRSSPILFHGGLVKEQRELKEPFVRTAVAFEVGGWSDPDLITTCVVQQLLGGASSFSAGGPGKGMYTRLYRNVLNRMYFVESANSFVQFHDEAGLIGIDGSCEPGYTSQLLRVMIDQLYLFAFERVTADELARAKNMLKSMMLMQLESRLVLCEDIGRQFLTYGKRADPESLCRQIDAVTAEDVMRVGLRIVEGNHGRPAVSCIGEDVSQCPSYEVITQFLNVYTKELKNKYNVGK